MIHYVTGDLFTTKAKVIAHGVNCAGVFNAGVAKQIAQHYPKAKQQYLDKYFKEGWILGEVQLVEIRPQGTIPLDYAPSRYRKIANCAIQNNYGRLNIRYVNYEAVAMCFKRLMDNCEYLHCDLAMPQIGAGLARGDWNIIKGILETSVEGRNVDVTVYSLG